jgi:hypothetical protein
MRKIAFVLWLMSLAPVVAQEASSSSEQNPFGLRWRQIKTDKFKVIFPKGLEQDAQRTTATLETVYEPVAKTLGRLPRRIPIILQNQTTISNGFVTILPRRSEFFTTPPQNNALLGTNQWLDLLAVHEYRHVVQYEKALTGWTKAFYYLFGNQGLGLVANVAVPNWFWEGDAVCTETALTNSGRGRIPQFDLAFRTQLLTRGAFSYPKATGRSLKDYVENHYVMGYYLTTYLKREYGADQWGQILNKTYKFPFYPFSFSNSIKKTTGLRVEQLYQKAVADVTKQWEAQQQGLVETPAEYLPTAANAVFTNYEYPQYFGDGRIVALKQGLGDIETFVTLHPEQGEKKLFVPGILNDAGMLSTSQNQLVWTEHHFDSRWGQRDYSILKVYDTNFDLLNQITIKSRIAAPAVSPDGKQVVAVETDQSNRFALVLYDLATGQLTKRLSNDSNDFFVQPRFTSDGRQIVVVSLNRQGKTIELIDLSTEQRTALMPRSQDNIGHPVEVGGKVLFNSPFSGIDNIYAIDIQTKATYQVTSRKYGAYNASVSPDGKNLIFNDFTAKGHRVAVMPYDPASWKPIADIQTKAVRYFGPLVAKESGGNILESVKEKNYDIKTYPRLSISQLNWGTILSSDSQNLKMGLTVQDLLGTTTLTGGVAFDANEQTTKTFASASYAGFYPILEYNFDAGLRRTTLYIDRREPLDSLRSDTWHQTRNSFGVRIPFNFTHSKFIQSLNLSASASFIKVRDYNLPVRFFSELPNGTFGSMNYILSYQMLLKQSPRDILPKWGGAFYTVIRNTPFGGRIAAQQFAVQGNLYLPGLAKHHSLRLRGGYQTQGQNDGYRFSGSIFYPRGNSYTALPTQLGTFTAEYRLPLLYPDLTIGRWFYIQRLKANLFYDVANYRVNLQNRTTSTSVSSVGLDLSADFNFMRFAQRLDVGVRALYLPQESRFLIQPLVIDIGF